MSDERKAKAVVDHPMSGGGRRSKGVTATPDNLEGAQKKLEELQEKEEGQDRPQKTFDPSEIRDLKDLVFLGYTSEVYEVSGYKFEISTLTNSEKRELLSKLAMTGPQMAAYIKAYTLAYSIRTVNSVPLIRLYEGSDDEELTDLDKKFAIIDSWQSSLVAALFRKYEELAGEAEGVFASEEGDGELSEKVKK